MNDPHLVVSEHSVFDKKTIYKVLPITYLVRGEYQPRTEFPNESLASLAETIKNDGVLEPLIVRPLNDQTYEIIAGERRWRAAQLARLDEVPCLIKNYSNEQAARIALIENISREDLDPIMEAKAVERIVNEFEYTHEEVAAFLGKPRTVITNILRLLKLDKRVQEFLSKGDLTEAHGKLLAGLPQDRQYLYALETINKSLTVKSLENLIKNDQNNKKIKLRPHKDINIVRLEKDLSEILCNPVSLTLNKNKSGVINISFHNYDCLDGVLIKLGYKKNDE